MPETCPDGKPAAVLACFGADSPVAIPTPSDLPLAHIKRSPSSSPSQESSHIIFSGDCFTLQSKT